MDIHHRWNPSATQTSRRRAYIRNLHHTMNSLVYWQQITTPNPFATSWFVCISCCGVHWWTDHRHDRSDIIYYIKPDRNICWLHRSTWAIDCGTMDIPYRCVVCCIAECVMHWYICKYVERRIFNIRLIYATQAQYTTHWPVYCVNVVCGRIHVLFITKYV